MDSQGSKRVCVSSHTLAALAVNLLHLTVTSGPNG